MIINFKELETTKVKYIQDVMNGTKKFGVIIVDVTDDVKKCNSRDEFLENVQFKLQRKISSFVNHYNQYKTRSGITSDGKKVLIFELKHSIWGSWEPIPEADNILFGFIKEDVTKEESLLGGHYYNYAKKYGKFLVLGTKKVVNNRYKGTAFEQEYMEYKIVPYNVISENFKKIYKFLQDRQEGKVYDLISSNTMKTIKLNHHNDNDLAKILFE